MSPDGLAAPVGPGALAVVFTSLRTAGDGGYAQTSEEMVRLAAGRPASSAWSRRAAPMASASPSPTGATRRPSRPGRRRPTTSRPQAAGKARWYRAYRIRVCRVEREYRFEG